VAVRRRAKAAGVRWLRWVNSECLLSCRGDGAPWNANDDSQAPAVRECLCDWSLAFCGAPDEGVGNPVSSVQLGRKEVVVTDVPRLGSLAAGGVGLGILTGTLAQWMSDSYGEDETSPLRVTAHATIPFLVLASTLTDHRGANAAMMFRGGFLGAHFVHMRQIARLVCAHGADERLIRVELAGGTLLYTIILLQTVLLTRQAQERVGIDKARRLSRKIDTRLLGVYCLATTSGLVRYRRPLPVYVTLAALLATALTSRKRRH
jgi:hypothetical protein